MGFLDGAGVTTLVRKLRSIFAEKNNVNKFTLLGTYESGTKIAEYTVNNGETNNLYIPATGTYYCLARVSANKSNNANVTSSPTLAITRQSPPYAWSMADSNTSLVCPLEGVYEVSGMILWNPSSSGTWLVTFVIGIGGTDYTAYATSTGGTRVSPTISPTIVSLSAGDKIDIRVTATGAGTIQSGVTLSRIAIRRIS